MLRGTKTLLCGLACATVLTGNAIAGGFNRGTANLEGLYGSDFGTYAGMTFVAPGRSYTNIVGTLGPSPDQTFSNNYFIPYASVGGNIAGDLNCVGSYTQPYGGDVSYSGALQFDTAEQRFTVNEFGLTCSYGVDAGPGRAYVIGGVFMESLNYFESKNFNVTGSPIVGQGAGASTLSLTDEAYGFRLGAAYEIPEIALRASVIYRSQTDYSATGTYSNTPFAALAVASGASVPVATALYGANLSAGASATASLPQSVDLNVRSGIAPGWLAFGQIKWTDWSVLQQIQVVEGLAGQPFSSSNFFFEDGWTVSGGLAHQFSDMVAGSAALTWDKGVSTGWDTLSDTWTVSGGVRLTKEKLAMNLGGGLIYFTEAAKTNGSYTASSPGEWGYALSASITGTF